MTDTVKMWGIDEDCQIDALYHRESSMPRNISTLHGVIKHKASSSGEK